MRRDIQFTETIHYRIHKPPLIRQSNCPELNKMYKKQYFIKIYLDNIRL